MTLKKKTLKKGGASTSSIIRNLVNRPISKEIGQMALKAVEHLPNGKKLNKEIITSIYPGDVHKRALKLYLDYSTALLNKPKPKLPINTEAKIAAAQVVTTGTFGAIVSGLLANIETNRNQVTSFFSGKDQKQVETMKAEPTKIQSSMLDNIKNIDMKKLDSKTATYISSLIAIAITGRIFYKKLTKQKITKQELEIEKLVEKEQSTPVKSPKKKSLINKIIQYGAIPLAGVMAVSQLKKTLKK